MGAIKKAVATKPQKANIKPALKAKSPAVKAGNKNVKKAQASQPQKKIPQGKAMTGKKKQQIVQEEEDDEDMDDEDDEIDSDEMESDEDSSAPMDTSSDKKLQILDDDDEEDEDDDDEGEDQDEDEEDEEEDDDEEIDDEPMIKKSAATGFSKKPETATKDFGRKPKIGDQTESSMRVFVRSLPDDASQESITSFFKEHGLNSQEVFMPRNSSGFSKGYAFVTFSQQSEVDKAVTLSGTEISGATLEISVAKPRSSKDAFPSSKPSAPTNVVFVKNLPYDITEHALLGHFPGAVGVRIPNDFNGKPKGFAFIEFGSVSEAQSQHDEKQGYEISGRTVQVDFAAPKPEKSGEFGSSRGFGNGDRRGGRGGGDRYFGSRDDRRGGRGGSGGFHRGGDRRGGFGGGRGGRGDGGFRGGNRGGRGGFRPRGRGSF